MLHPTLERHNRKDLDSRLYWDDRWGKKSLLVYHIFHHRISDDNSTSFVDRKPWNKYDIRAAHSDAHSCSDPVHYSYDDTATDKSCIYTASHRHSGHFPSLIFFFSTAIAYLKWTKLLSFVYPSTTILLIILVSCFTMDPGRIDKLVVNARPSLLTAKIGMTVIANNTTYLSILYFKPQWYSSDFFLMVQNSLYFVLASHTDYYNNKTSYINILMMMTLGSVRDPH